MLRKIILLIQQLSESEHHHLHTLIKRTYGVHDQEEPEKKDNIIIHKDQTSIYDILGEK